MNWLRRKWGDARLRLPLKWWFSGFTAILGAFAGLLGSVWAEQIKAAFPFIWPTTGPIVWPAVIFWASLLLFGMLFGLGFNAQNEATNKLEQVIRTLPPRGFLIGFEGFFKQSFGVDWKAEAAPNLDTLRSAISTTLVGVAHMVKAFDSRFDNPSYSANIMLFRQVANIQQKDLEELILFAEPGYNPQAWDGVLQLQTEFALTLRDGKPEPDTQVRPILLPIPKMQYRTDKGRPTILPGAPTVFCDPLRYQYAGFENTLQLAVWCREQSGLRESIAEEIERYFVDGPGKSIRSFISIPIVTQESEPQVLGVLNLHSDREGLLPGERPALFVPLTSPFVLLIARNLQRYIALSKGS